MVSFKNYLKTDWYKFLKSKIIISHIVIPIIGLILMLTYFKLESWSEVEEVSGYIEIISTSFPLIISILITMVYEQEEEAGSQYFLSTPNKRYIPHISKLFLIFFFGIIATMISMLGFGLSFNIMGKDNFSMMFYFILAVIIFTSNIPLYILHYLLVFSFGKGTCMGIGIIGSLVAALMATGIGDGLWYILPWGYSTGLSLYFFKYEITNDLSLMLHSEVKLAIISVITVIVVSITLLRILSVYWEGKKEYS